ncbi:protein of unknown function [Pseudomonas sp. JV551A1]|nr:protein of unknown function [Pseudomonas sp. JV551A1]
MPRAQCVTVLDGGQNRLVPGQGEFVEIGALVGIAHRLAQCHRQHVAQVGQQVVVGGVGDAGVEVQVRLQAFFMVACGFHALVGLGDRIDILGAGVGGGQRGGSGLDDPAYAAQHVEEFLLWCGLHQPMQYVGVEHVPVVARPDQGTYPWAGLDQALGGKGAHGLAEHRPADRVGFAQAGLGRQLLPGCELAGDDLDAKVLDQGGVHALARGGLAVVHVGRGGSFWRGQHHSISASTRGMAPAAPVCAAAAAPTGVVSTRSQRSTCGSGFTREAGDAEDGTGFAGVRG